MDKNQNPGSATLLVAFRTWLTSLSLARAVESLRIPSKVRAEVKVLICLLLLSLKLKKIISKQRKVRSEAQKRLKTGAVES
jgi:hypothetical protein